MNRRRSRAILLSALMAFADNPRHRRAKLVALTPRGRSTLAGIDRRQAAWSNRLATGVPLKDLRVALRTLEAVRRRLEEERAEGAGSRGGER